MSHSGMVVCCRQFCQDRCCYHSENERSLLQTLPLPLCHKRRWAQPSLKMVRKLKCHTQQFAFLGTCLDGIHLGFENLQFYFFRLFIFWGCIYLLDHLHGVCETLNRSVTVLLKKKMLRWKYNYTFIVFFNFLL